ncbi:MAG: hypothetical protein OT477_23360 [Chloroflexi bacterium]|nr:hypothetical protein [Chloroflexota bacterium]
MTNADKIRDFHAAINGVAMPTRPTVPALDLLLLRQKLVDEEYEEVTAAFHELAEKVGGGGEVATADLTPLVHELTDLLYVTYGAILSCGVDPDAVFAEVHEANMRKTTGPRRADGKQLKPEGWQPADVRGVLADLEVVSG